jgi:hypothetical protein
MSTDPAADRRDTATLSADTRPRRGLEAATDPDPSIERLLRRGLAVLAVIGTVGVAVELALLRHWSGLGQIAGWAGVVALAIAVIAVRAIGSPRAVSAVRALAVVALVVGLVGVGLHVQANFAWGPVDSLYGPAWETTALPIKLLLAATDTIGKAPAVAPGALSFVALTLLLATIRLPPRSAAAHLPPAVSPATATGAPPEPPRAPEAQTAAEPPADPPAG